jgi:hypothetical protein
MAFLSQKGEIRIANEAQGNWRISNEVWESNDGMNAHIWEAHYSDDWNITSRYKNLPYMRTFTSPKKQIDDRFKQLNCEWCDKHAKLYRYRDDLCCEDCVETVMECYSELNSHNDEPNTCK